MSTAANPEISTAAVEISGVTHRFRSKRSEVLALHDISLRVEPGEFVSLVGPSGCGKSTLLRIVAGLLRPSDGSASLLGRTVERPQRDIGFVFQRAALLEWRSARKNIMLQAEIRRMSTEHANQRADQLIEMVGLTGFEDALPHELSGGMQQRVALCRALLHDPPVLLMDEPFGALDALTREHMNTELHRICRETGSTVVFVTHSITEAIYLANRVVVMGTRPGRIREILPVELPEVRDYHQTMSHPAFDSMAGHLRELFGAAHANR